MTVNYFRVESAGELAALLTRASALTIGDREWAHDSAIVFLEEYQRSSQDCFMDFTKRSPTGPGYSEPKSKTVDFPMSPGAGFAQQTAAILRGDYMAVQYNHFGVRHSAITTYLSSVLDTNTRVQITPMIRDDAFDRFTGSSRHGRLTFAVNARVLIQDLSEDDVALSAALRMATEVEAGVVTIDLSYGNGKKGGPLSIRNTGLQESGWKGWVTGRRRRGRDQGRRDESRWRCGIVCGCGTRALSTSSSESPR